MHRDFTTIDSLNDIPLTPDQRDAVIPKEHLEKWQEMRLRAIAGAIAAYGLDAESYRGFHVGAAMLVFNKDTGLYGVLEHGNYTKSPGPHNGNAKRCAERQCLEEAQGHGATDVIGLVTTSPETNTEGPPQNGHDVLLPCEECQKMLADSPLVRPWTKIELVRLSNGAKELRGNNLAITEQLTRLTETHHLEDAIHSQKTLSWRELQFLASRKK